MSRPEVHLLCPECATALEWGYSDDPDEGAVRIDGIDLREVTEESLRSAMGIVPQEGHLFSGTIAENVRFAHPLATDDDVRRALDARRVEEEVHIARQNFHDIVDKSGEGLLLVGHDGLVDLAGQWRWHFCGAGGR